MTSATRGGEFENVLYDLDPESNQYPYEMKILV